MHSTESPAVFTQPMDRKLVIVILAVELGAILTVGTVLLATGSKAWIVALILALMVLPIVLIWTSRLTVRLAEDRLRYLFFPFWRGSIDYRDIERVEVIKINPMGEFGGWGPKWKLTYGRGFGLIARGGPGVRIDRINKSPVYITMDNADELAVAIMERTVGDRPERS